MIQGAATAVFTMIAMPKAWRQLRAIIPCQRIATLNFRLLIATADAHWASG